MNLYDYSRSSAAYRVRIALNIKGIPYRAIPISLLQSEQRSENYLALNPQGLVPSLALDNGEIITQSSAIIEWLEQAYPQPTLLPGDALQQAKIRAAANAIACDIHPLNNLRVLNYLVDNLGANESTRMDWYHHWIEQGFSALEQQLPPGQFAFGDELTRVDVFLIPQVFNALRFEVDMSFYPKLLNAYKNCNELEPFKLAAPEAG